MAIELKRVFIRQLAGASFPFQILKYKSFCAGTQKTQYKMTSSLSDFSRLFKKKKTFSQILKKPTVHSSFYIPSTSSFPKKHREPQTKSKTNKIWTKSKWRRRKSTLSNAKVVTAVVPRGTKHSPVSIFAWLLVRVLQHTATKTKTNKIWTKSKNEKKDPKPINDWVALLFYRCHFALWAKYKHKTSALLHTLFEHTAKVLKKCA